MSDEKLEEMSINPSQFEEIERDFHEMLTKLVGDSSLEGFRREYQQLHQVLKKSHDHEKRLVKKCRELNADIVANAAKVQMALKLSQEDQATIQELRKEIERAWKMVEAAHEKEARGAEIIKQLKEEISNLSKLVEHGAGLSLEENSIQEMVRERDELAKERDGLVNQVVGLRNELSEMMDKVRNLEKDKGETEKEIVNLKDLIAMKKQEAEREARRKERLEMDVKEYQQQVADRQAEIKKGNEKIKELDERLTILSNQYKEQKMSAESLQKQLDQQNQKTLKLQSDLDENMSTSGQLLATNSQLMVELNMKEAECERLKNEAARISKLRDGLQKKYSELEQKKKDVEEVRDQLRAEILQLEKSVENQRRQVDLEHKHIDDLMRERDLLNKNLQKAVNATGRQSNLVKINEGQKKTLEQEIAGYKTEAQQLRKQIYVLEKDREKYGTEASEATAKFLMSQQELKQKDIAINDLQKKISESDGKLKNQQNLYEAVRSDRNLYSKHLIEAQDEIAEMHRRFKIMTHQIDQLKEEISAKDHALVKEHFEHMKVDKEKESLKYNVAKLRQQIEEGEATITTQKAEISKLEQIIKEADAERLRQKKEFEDVINERDILGTQLIRRNDELALLYEKIKIQQSTLHNGEIQYRQRLQDIRMLKLKISELKRELHILRASVSNIDTLRNEVYHLQRELLQERTKVKALSEELENPMNVHRWRKLEGSDPTTYELIKKSQTLQKRLIAKTEEVIEKDLLIQEKEKLYVELRNILARQPGPEVAEQLNIYQQNLREKTKQLKAMASELNMYQANVSGYKYEIERLTKELQEEKKRFYELKRKEQQRLRKSQPNNTMPQPMPSSAPRFSGGGFNLASTS